MPDKLLYGVRMLTFTQSREMLGANCALKIPLLG
jgi:hypothetical protein